MKITKTLNRHSVFSSFFRIFESDLSICQEFTEKLSGEKISKQSIARFDLNTKNPKEKGFKKVTRISTYEVELGGTEFSTLSKHNRLFEDFGIKIGDSFWMKVELA